MTALEGSEGPGLGGRHVLLGVSGGIAAYKAVILARLLVTAGAEVQVIMTPTAADFVGPATFAAVTHRPVPSQVMDTPEQVVHVRMAHWADLAIVAPATANTLARLSLGLADDLVTSTLLEAGCPLILAPAMHSGMWSHPATQAHIRTLQGRGAVVVGPVEGALAAGDEGIGRMAEPQEIFAAAWRAAAAVRSGSDDLEGRMVLVTAGPTHEPIDAVRYIANRSSGRMGFAVASEAARRGARVVLVAGPVALTDPSGVEVIRVETAEQMAGEVLSRYASADAVVMAAAVADFRPREAVDGKLKKERGLPDLVLEPTTDILLTLGKRKEGQILVGFAAETDRVQDEGRRKLAEKNLDLMVANEVGRPGTGFGSATNRAAILARQGEDTPMAHWTKEDLAAAICERMAGLLRSR